jgi:hypothetical protein
MEAALFVMDIVAIILLVRGVRRVDKSGNAEMLGLFNYADLKRDSVPTASVSTKRPNPYA